MAKRAGPGRHIRRPDRNSPIRISARASTRARTKNFFPKNLTFKKFYDIILKKTIFKAPLTD
jgi:hypothetical protein